MLEVEPGALLIRARDGEHLRFRVEAAKKRDARRPAFSGEAVRHRYGRIAAQVRGGKMIANRARRRRARRGGPSGGPTGPTRPIRAASPASPTGAHIDVRRDVD